MIPNLITLYRLLSIPFFIWFLKQSLRGWATLIFGIAIISDFIDGYLARKILKKNEIGALLDPLADKFLLMSSFVCLYMFKNLPLNIPFWVVLVVLTRDLILLLGGGLMLLMGIKFKIEPTIWGKLTTFFQMFTVLSVLLNFRFSFIFWEVACIFTVISGVDYMVKGIKIINKNTDVAK